MSHVKLQIFGNFFSAIWIISITMIIDAAVVKIGSQSSEMSTLVKPPFEDFRTEAEVYSEHEKTLRLKITWKPNTTNDSSFYVLVKPIDGGLCHDESCSVYRYSTNATLFVPEVPPNSDVFNSHSCDIAPGCNYTVLVESDKFESKLIYRVPDRVGNVFSCQHAKDLPNARINATIDSQIMTIFWEINEVYNVPSDIKVYILIKISDQNNRDLKMFNQTLFDGNKQRYGQFKWTVPSTKINYITRTFVVDSNDCSSTPFVLSIRLAPVVPVTTEIIKTPPAIPDNTYSVHVVWLIIGVFSSVIILIASLIYFKKQKPNAPYQTIFCNHTNPTGLIRPPGIAIKMEDNPKYDILEEIPHSSLRLLKEIGKGAFGTVYLACGENICGIPGSQNVAVKQLRKRPTEEEKEEFFAEIQTMKTVSRHPNIVALLGCCTIKDPLQIVMEYVGCGDLLNYLRKVRAKHEERFGRRICEPEHPLLPTPFGRYLDLMNSSTGSTSDSSHATDTDGNLRPSVTETMYTTLSQTQDRSSSTTSSLEYVLDHKELHNFATQIAKGMKHLHEKQITHRDLAARNILIDENKTLKISDFGLSRSGIYVNTKNKKVPLRWLSIEAMRDNLYSNKSDVWAFGIVLWEIGTLGGYPYPTVSNHELLAYLSSGTRLEQPENCSKYLYELMLHCWADKPDDRPGFSEILSKLEPVHQKIYVDFSELSSDYVFPPTKEQILNNKLTTALKVIK